MSFPFYKQQVGECGLTCLRMITKHFGKSFSMEFLREITGTASNGISMLGISDAAEKIGFKTIGLQININNLNQIDLPVILHWKKHHFVVLYKIEKSVYYIADPSKGLTAYNSAEFISCWKNAKSQKESKGFILAFECASFFT